MLNTHAVRKINFSVKIQDLFSVADIVVRFSTNFFYKKDYWNSWNHRHSYVST